MLHRIVFICITKKEMNSKLIKEGIGVFENVQGINDYIMSLVPSTHMSFFKIVP